MIRIFSARPLSAGLRRFEPDREERHHLGVRRAQDGDPIEVVDGRGGVAVGRLKGEPKRGWIEVDDAAQVVEPPALVLMVGAGDRDRFLWLVEKGQELGATAIVPVVTERVAGVASRVRADHRARAERRAIEALKQSGSRWLVAVADPTPLDDALRSTAAAHRWLADPAGGSPTPVGDESAAVLVGPEGGLTQAERELAVSSGFRPVRLGPATLRYETAAIAAAAWVTISRGRQP